MKKFFSIAALLFVATALITSNAFADLPQAGWWTGQQVQNVGTAATTIDVTAYDTGATPVTYSASQSVANGASYTFVPSSFSGMPDGFQGSAVVSAGQPIKAIVNLTNRQAGTLGIAGGKAAGQYQGIDSTMVDETLYFPLVKGNFYLKTTTFYVQNAGTAAAVATATFTMQNGDTHTYNIPSIGANQMATFTVQDATTFNDTLPSGDPGRVGSLTVTSAQPLAGVVVEHFTTETVGTIVQATRGFTSGDFDDKAYAPVTKNGFYNRFTGVQVQNVSAAAIDVTVTFTGVSHTGATNCDGQTYTNTTTGLAAGASYTFVQRTTSGSNLPEGCLASATITATGNFVATVNESFVTLPATGQRAVTSFAMPDNSATAKISAPLFKDSFYSKNSGLQVQNVGTATATNVVATFQCTTESSASFTAITLPQTIAAGSAMTFINPSTQPTWFTVGNPFVSGHANCGVTVTADQPIVAIVNEAPMGTTDQDTNNYEGFNLAP